ncbi:autotransporter outer membrane beta-barrel domain-containing protein [Yersinia rohdei]|uniref:autotransporter outer membrane beta-barrel domain-containing protein n=1 Tax=Yersinia rohdei TaxID=29485 RepID=UPI0011A8C4FD|nr:autotransporter outer membrane beta-barrel domain-containing protein [Yersinia rohdei]
MKVTFPSKLSAIALACSCVFTGSEASELTDMNEHFHFFEDEEATDIKWNVNHTHISFMGNSNAANAWMNFHQGSELLFSEVSNGGDATLKFYDYSSVRFHDSSSAGNATLNFNEDSSVRFHDSSSAGNATLNFYDHSSVWFYDSSSAGNAKLNLNYYSSVWFYGSSSTGNAKLSLDERAYAVFNDNSSAGNATLNFNADSFVRFFHNSSAGNATLSLATGAKAEFFGNSSAGSAIIDSDGLVTFKSQADADNATLMGSGTFDFSDTSGREGNNYVHAGLIEGDGTIKLGNNNFVIGNEQSNTNFSGVIEGSGTLTKQGSGHIVLSGNNTYQGDTYINSGGLILQGGAENNPIIKSENIYIGNKDKPNTQTYLAATGYLKANVHNNGSLYIDDSTDPEHREEGHHRLKLEGDYSSLDGALHFHTKLNSDDDSEKDQLWITGDVKGNTTVYVHEAGGAGAKTLHGIPLIKVDGNIDGTFTQAGRIVAGAYDYELKSHRHVITDGTTRSAADPMYYYLSSNIADEDSGDSTTSPRLEQHIKRPEAGSYIANLAAANNMFINRLSDRQAEMEYFDPLSGERKMTSMWLRNEGGHNRSHDTSGQLKTQANRYVVQLGGDVLRWNSNDQDLWRVGLMAGYGNSRSTTTSNARGYNAKSKADGYSVGIYGTWFANLAEQTGPYADSWVQYSWFNNSVDGEGLAREEYDSKGVSASLEGGYTFKVGEDKSHSYFIQPQAQAVWMGVKADDHRETNGTQVRGEGDNNVQTRLGIRAFMKSDNGKGQRFEPFAEANWLYNTNEFGVTMNGATIEQAGAKNIAELKLGVEGNINQQLNAWGNVGQQIGDKGYSETNVMLGVKYSF